MSATEASGAHAPRDRWFLKLYPRDWRARYGDELSAMVGDRPLSLPNAIDLIAGAIDARFTKEKKMPSVLRSACLTRTEPQTVADGLRGAGVMIGASLIFLALGMIAKREGYPDTAETLKGMSFPVSLVLMSHVMYMRKQSPIAKWIITGGSLALLTVISFVATKL
jgi:hypothetical protein